MPLQPFALFVLALCASRAFGPGAPIYWDSFAYVTQCVSHHVGGLLLGRPLFILTGQITVDLFASLGLSVFRAEALLRALCTLFSALSPPLLWALATRLGLSPRTALFAGVSLALSPAFAHTSEAVLTDAPATTLLLASLLCVSHPQSPSTLSRVFSSGLLFGMACAVREPTLAFALCHISLLSSYPRVLRVSLFFPWVLGLGLGLGSPVLWAALSEPGYLSSPRAWLLAMRLEEAHNPRSLRSLGVYFVWLLTLGPAFLGAALITACSPSLRREFSLCARCFVLPSAAVLASLAFYQDISFSPRYLLPALPGAIALPAAVFFDAFCRTRTRFAFTLLALMAPLAATPWLRASERARVRAVRELPGVLRALRADSVVVTGQLCPAVVMLRALALREPSSWAGPPPAWRTVCPGWGWPEELPRALDTLRAEGRPLVLDLRESVWVGPRQKRCLMELRRYAREHPRSFSAWPESRSYNH